jgi:predicted metalloendopeptidase
MSEEEAESADLVEARLALLKNARRAKITKKATEYYSEQIFKNDFQCLAEELQDFQSQKD